VKKHAQGYPKAYLSSFSLVFENRRDCMTDRVSAFKNNSCNGRYAPGVLRVLGRDIDVRTTVVVASNKQ
jgi:hypothetical protein